MALPSNNQNNKDVIKGFVLIAVIIIGIAAVVLHFMPSDEESTPDPTSTPEPPTVLDPNSKEESIRLVLQYYKTVDEPFRNLYEHCENISNYDEYNAFATVMIDLNPIFSKYSTLNDEMKDGILRAGLEDNVEINNAANNLSILLELLSWCISDVSSTYGQ